jgi:1,4-alpha-glucan branching enzyme
MSSSGGTRLGDIDLYLAGEGRHEQLYEKLGAHVGEDGVSFAVWAPNATKVSVVGEWNNWNGRANPMEQRGSSGIWETVCVDAPEGALYRYELTTRDGQLLLKSDPYAFAAELPPGNASRIFRSRHEWGDDAWLERRRESAPYTRPMSIYEVHLGSWRRTQDNQPLSYRDLAQQLGAYVKDLGFTHVELLPVMEHPYSGSWGYQVTGYFAPTSRFGDPDEFRAFVDELHRQEIGVILDWVPAHFPRDEWALARFDGTALYEHEDPRRGAHPDWGTLVFNYGRNEVRNFLLSNALYWLKEFHADGGREDLDAVAFLQQLNEVVHGREPGAISAAEESTAWPGVSRPVYLGGLGFGFKWNMGWMHDTLDYFANDPIHRRYHHHQLTFSLVYAFSENFILPLSHDEVVHGKGSLVEKMPGDRWQKLANLRALYGYMWAHPGKNLVFMGGELAQSREWNAEASLDWHLLEDQAHQGVQSLVRDLNRVYQETPALWQDDFEPTGFRWLEPNAAGENVLAFLRLGTDEKRPLVCVCNFSPVPRYGYRLGLPLAGEWREAVNTDAAHYGGSDVGNLGRVEADETPWHDQPFSAEVTLPPLATVWLVPA